MQGSPSGPIFWNILYDDLLRLPFNVEYVTPQTYADDAVLVVRASTCPLAIARAEEALKLLFDWAVTVSLTFNPTKSQVLCLGRGSNSALPPILMNNQPLPYVRELRYLGVILDPQLNFAAHIRQSTQKASLVLERFARVARSDWGIGPRAMKIIWNCAIEPAVTYASPVWAGKAHVDYNRRRLKTLQRKALLRVSRAYRTVSHDALWIITGVTPITLKINELATYYYVLRGIAPATEHYSPPYIDCVPFNTIERRPEYFSGTHPSVPFVLSPPADETTSIAAVRRLIHTRVINDWQTLWDASDKGRLTYNYFPSVADRLALKHFHSSLVLTQYLTGHGDMNAYFHRFRIRESDICPHCPAIDSVFHRLIICNKYETARQTFFNTLQDMPQTLSDFNGVFAQSSTDQSFRQFLAQIIATNAILP
jgi:hypothetical protein